MPRYQRGHVLASVPLGLALLTFACFGGTHADISEATDREVSQQIAVKPDLAFIQKAIEFKPFDLLTLHKVAGATPALIQAPAPVAPLVVVQDTPHTQRESSGIPGSHNLLRGNIRDLLVLSDAKFLQGVIGFIVVAVFTLCMNEVFGLYGGVKGHGLPMTKIQRRLLQCLALGTLVADVTETSFLSPLSYDMAWSIRGCGSKDGVATLSGFILGSPPAGMACGVCMAFCVSKLKDDKLSRRLMMISPVVSACLYIALAGILFFAESWQHFLEQLVLAIFFVRGCVGGFALLIYTLARNVTPSAEQGFLSIWEYMAQAAGLCVGALLSSMSGISVETPRCGQYHQAIRASSFVACLYAVLALGASLCVPASMQDFQELSEEDSEEDGDRKSDDKQKWMLCITLLAIFMGVFSCAAVESSSAFILELQYGWGPPRIGSAMAIVFATCVFVLALVLGLQMTLHIADGHLIGALSVAMMVGVGLIFDFGQSAAHQILIADSVLYPSLTALT
ncbi:unnamed protein product [Polarella glacialis]|uniref:Uncharacterized protein n=2 Tax=Polarella glacialis TaxID=89957 RepID=A0A813JKN6_POLGL|nr:unnamed protein product [Polarella glacialis]